MSLEKRMSSNSLPSDGIKVMTFNIRYKGTKEDPADPLSWAARGPALLRYLAKAAPDIFCLQEVTCDQLEEIQAFFREHYFSYGVFRDGEQGEACPVFWKRDSFRILKKGTFWLSETPDIVSSFPGAHFNRVCSYVAMERAGWKPFFVLNTHFDHTEQERVRVRSAELVLKMVQDIVGLYPCILTGDFNCTWKTSSPYRVLVSSFLKDTRPPSASTSTFPGYLSRSNPVDKDLTVGDTIDFVFTSGFDSTSAEYSVDNPFKFDLSGRPSSISDHRPVVVSNLRLAV